MPEAGARRPSRGHGGGHFRGSAQARLVGAPVDGRRSGSWKPRVLTNARGKRSWQLGATAHAAAAGGDRGRQRSGWEPGARPKTPPSGKRRSVRRSPSDAEGRVKARAPALEGRREPDRSSRAGVNRSLTRKDAPRGVDGAGIRRFSRVLVSKVGCRSRGEASSRRLLRLPARAAARKGRASRKRRVEGVLRVARVGRSGVTAERIASGDKGAGRPGTG